MDQMIADTAQRMFADLQDNPEALWKALEESGLTAAWVPESLGGAGLSLSDGFGLMRIGAQAAAQVPFAETLLASFLLSAAGMETPSGALSIPCGEGEVPFAGTVSAVVNLSDAGKVQLYTAPASKQARSVGGDPIGLVDLSELEPAAEGAAPSWLTRGAFANICAIARSAQLCGAMEGALSLTLEHTSMREQFGRPLTKFQAIQHLLADMAGELAASTAAVDAAVETVSRDGAPDFRSAACAKIRAGEAAGVVAANAHQAHGAIGYTQEYALARYTRRLWRWRDEFGTETAWAVRLGRDFTGEGANALTQEIFGAA